MSLEVEMIVPDGVVLHTHVSSAQAADASGRFGLLPGHERFVTLLAPCVLVFREVDGRQRYAAADGGVLNLCNDHLSIVTREAVVAERLEEVAESAAAMLKARMTEEATARAEFAELQASLLRELNKLEKKR